jgi:hypothetical protein
MEISWTYLLKNEVLHSQEENNILRKIKRVKANWIGHILRTNGLVKHVIKGQT